MRPAPAPGPGARRTIRRSALALALLVLPVPARGATPSAAPAEDERPTSDCASVRPPDLRRICERGELRVARYSGERPPFFHREGERWVGFEIDLGRDIAAKLGVAYREDNSAASFDHVVEMVADGAADIGLSKLSNTLDRARRVRFTGPYLTVYQALLVNRLSVPASGDPFRLLSAPGFVIGALAGSAYVGFAERYFSGPEVRPYDDFERLMNDVAAGEIDAALMDSARADTWRRSHRAQLVQVRTTIDKSKKDPLAIAVGWESTHLLAWLDLYLERIKGDGTARRLYRKWFVEPAAGAGEAPGGATE